MSDNRPTRSERTQQGKKDIASFWQSPAGTITGGVIILLAIGGAILAFCGVTF